MLPFAFIKVLYIDEVAYYKHRENPEYYYSPRIVAEVGWNPKQGSARGRGFESPVTWGVVFLLFFYNRVSGRAKPDQDSAFFFCLFGGVGKWSDDDELARRKKDILCSAPTPQKGYGTA
ncbi:hypothetical protein ES708_22601 [subsurface metagenome]